MQKVFISCSSKDTDWVKNELIPRFEAGGIVYYIDFRDFDTALPQLANIEKAFDICDRTIIILSPDWVKNEQSRFESMMQQTEHLAERERQLLPVMIETCTIPDWIKMSVCTDCTDLDNCGTEIQKLMNRIRMDFLFEEGRRAYLPVSPECIDITRLPETGLELFGRQNELALLNKAWASKEKNIICFIAGRGTGKSALVKKWVEKMRWDNYRGAERVFAWSFNTGETGSHAESADAFIDRALHFFGDRYPEQGQPVDKGKHLAALISACNTLLILDGLEPLQSGTGTDNGSIGNPALSVLIRELAESNKGLCVITSREYIPELVQYKKKTACINLVQISDEARLKHIEPNSSGNTENNFRKAAGE